MARFFLLLVVIAVVAGGVAYYLNWFHVTVNEEKVKQDTAVAEQKAREFGAKANEEARELGKKAKGLLNKDGQKPVSNEPVTARGEITQLQMGLAGADVVLHTADNHDLTFQTDAGTKVLRNDKSARLGDLKPGDQAAVVYQTKDGKNVALSITVAK